MTEFKATASAHMRRDLEAGTDWTCECEACVQIRSLVGVQKMLDVRPLIRSIGQRRTQIDGLAPGPDREQLVKEYLGLQDQLAKVIAE
jgi:hypothetical protein